MSCIHPAADHPTARDLLIALHVDRRLPLAHKRRLAASIVRRTAASGAAGPNPQLPPAAVALLAPLLPLAAAEEAAAATLGARLVTVADADFPPVLAHLAQATQATQTAASSDGQHTERAIGLAPPWVLTVRGALPSLPAVAIVGSRQADLYGRETARRFAQQLAGAGIAVVSGLARGIDAAAHAGALAAGGGVTVAVLGCGLGVDYPRDHAQLAAAISRRGAVVSEFTCDTPPRRWQFNRRGRTLAALCALTLVVQATPRSGALVTAAHARSLGRLVCAIPGPVGTPLSWGPNWLLQQGSAWLVSDPGDVLDLLTGIADGPLPRRARPRAQAREPRARCGEG